MHGNFLSEYLHGVAVRARELCKACYLSRKSTVGDGDRRGKYLRLWKLTEDGYSEPRALCMHNCTFKMQSSHVHPRITPDGKAVLYTSDESGYNQLYIVKIPEDIDTLPLLKDVWSC